MLQGGQILICYLTLYTVDLERAKFDLFSYNHDIDVIITFSHAVTIASSFLSLNIDDVVIAFK